MGDRRQQAERWGRKAEARAAMLMRFKGYRILARRFKTPVGEIDLITTRGGVLVFTEIKARATVEDGLHAVTPTAQARIAKAASLYMAQLKGPAPDVRFDVIVVTPKRMPHHLPDAWRPLSY